MCGTVMLLALESISLLLLLFQLLAAGRLARGRRAAGSCWDFKVPQVVHRLLLCS